MPRTTPFDFVDTELHQRLTISGVTVSGVGEKAGAFLNKASISVHAEYFHAVAGQLFGKRGAETAQAENNNGGCPYVVRQPLHSTFVHIARVFGVTTVEHAGVDVQPLRTVERLACGPDGAGVWLGHSHLL